MQTLIFFCFLCKRVVDIEDVYFKNQCPYCSESFGYKDDYDNLVENNRGGEIIWNSQ